MCASPFDFLRSAPPPPRVALLSDALFFVRFVPVSVEPKALDGADAAEQVARQVELALEVSSPFPLAQLYYGHFWVPGSDRAVVFASYKRRFTAEQTAAWRGAERVFPAFVALLGAAVEPATTVVLNSPEGLTAVHWDAGPVPANVWFQPIPPEANDEEREHARTDLLKMVESRKIVDLASPPVAEALRGDGGIVFHCGDLLSRLPGESVGAIDVRDKEELAAIRRTRARDVLLWRVGIACVALFGLLALGEAALFTGGIWQQARRVKYNAQAPIVAKIVLHQEIADRINDLSSKRLLPMEMIRAVAPNKEQYKIYFTKAATTDRYTLTVDAATPNAGEVAAFKNDLSAKPECANVAIKNQLVRDNVTTFTLVVTFKPGALKPSTPPS